jgi:hypothetical protein
MSGDLLLAVFRVSRALKKWSNWHFLFLESRQSRPSSHQSRLGICHQAQDYSMRIKKHCSCGSNHWQEMNPNPSYDPTKNFGKIYVGVIEAYQCLKCHAQGAKTDLHSYKSTSNYVVPLAPEFSQLYVTLKTPDGADHTISKADLDTIGQWILDGASFL